jgi:hypothetical protein
MSMALSDLEVQNIQAFVKQGGIVIADALPGVMDNHTKYRNERALADVFGIKARLYSREELVTPNGETDLKNISAEVLVNENNKIQLLRNKYGDGAAYFLNRFMDEYPEEKLSNTNDESLSKIRNIFERENLKSGISIKTPAGKAENGIEKYAFSKAGGSARLLGLLPGKEGKDREVLLHFDSPVNLYDIRNTKYLGESNEFKINIQNSVPELYGLLPGKIEDIKIRAKPDAKPGETVTLDFNITGEKVIGFNSVARIEVFNPKGEKINYHSKNCDIKNGSGSYSFNVALNDPKGLWKICVTEVISGIKKEVSVNVK